MKRTVCFVLSVFIVLAGKGQSFDEWFHQKKTQLSYLGKQIAALQAFIQVTEEGSKIVQQGTQAIAAAAKGDLDQHSGYFASLGIVRPGIGSDPVVGVIIRLGEGVVAVATQARQLAISPWTETVSSFFDGLLADRSFELDWLGKLTTDGQVLLTDKERKTGIDEVYQQMKHLYEAAVRARNSISIIHLNASL